ncbi:MAG: hypothetical protein NC204_02665 [Candidatus Amulumruptor caecigallinarius]|nr:hypothetical protein [Candidatus Amulumruptor caecigallinarius]
MLTSTFKSYRLQSAAALCLLAMSAQTASAGESTPAEPKQENDKVMELSELVVKSDRVWIENGKAVFIPRKSEKNLSRDMNGLIDRMHTGILNVRDGVITDPDGQPVNIFINGVPADNLDISTFWPKNVNSVEYLTSSDDPRYLGKNSILNFVVKEYSAGGLTRFEVDQTFPNEGDYSVASKLVYGKMTYNAMFRGSYSRDHLSGRDFSESFDDIWYDGLQYDNITKSERTDESNRRDNMYGGFTARYRSDKFMATHKAALEWSRNPESTVAGELLFRPDVISGNISFALTNSRSMSPEISGRYAWFASRNSIYYCKIKS